MLLSDMQGKVLSQVLMYNDDSSSQQLGRLEAPPDSPAASATAGLPKAMQLAEVLRADQALVQHQADWLSGWLCDNFGYSDENNALKTGFDVINRQWPDWVLKALPGHVHLPEVCAPGSRIGHAGKALQALGVPASAQVVAGTTDSTAAFLATGVSMRDQGVTTLGSTLVLKQLSRQPITDSAAGIYSHRLGDAWLTGGASNTGGNVLRQYFSDEQIRRLSQQMVAQQPTGLDYYPLNRPGERFPHNDPRLAARLQPRPSDDSAFLQGMLEGIANIEAMGYEKLNSLGTAPIKQVISTGGGAANPVWNKIRERILGVPVITAAYTEAAYGAARLARQGSALFDDYLKT
jgi:sugar (pentulose or hexulose) kinase